MPVLKSLPRKKFSKINVEISNICNLQCGFCPEVIREKKLMTTELFTRIIQQVAPLTELVCFHLMGDPLVHPRLSELVDVCEESGVRVFFVTNGVLLRDEKMDLLLRPPFQQVNFSLHSFPDNFPGKDPSAYLEKIFRFTEKAFIERPDLYLNYRLWNLNDVRGSQTDNSQILEKVCDRFGVVAPQEWDLRRRKSVQLKNRLYLHFDTEFIWPSLDLPVLGTQGRCHGLSSHFGILVDGTVVPCCLDKEAAIPLGNIADQDILEILDRPRTQQILNGFRQRKLVENLCQRCQYIERFQPAEIPAEAKPLA
jgi:radical SAM protein with 4Fe4S-binding SPASM domain